MVTKNHTDVSVYNTIHCSFYTAKKKLALMKAANTRLPFLTNIQPITRSQRIAPDGVFSRQNFHQ